MGCGVSDLSLSEITYCPWNLSLLMNSEQLQNVNSDALSFRKLPCVLSRKFALGPCFRPPYRTICMCLSGESSRGPRLSFNTRLSHADELHFSRENFCMMIGLRNPPQAPETLRYNSEVFQ